MNVYKLQEKYPDLWKEVESVMMEDCRQINRSGESVIPDKTAKRLAHNAAFLACSEHHKLVSGAK